MSDDLTAGALLRALREQTGMSLTQVSDATNIRRQVVEALEHDDLGPSGGTAYARGHIKSICAVLGVDAGPVLARVGAPPAASLAPDPVASRRSERAVTLGASLSETVGASVRPARTGPNWSAVMAAAIVVIVAFGVFQVVRGGGSGGAPPVAGSQTGSVRPPSAPSTPSSSDPVNSDPPSVPSSSPPRVAQADVVTVELTVTGTASWVSASNAKGTVYEGTLHAGDTKTFTDRKKIKFIFGNAGAVELVVNGVDVGSPGGKGQVVRQTFGPGDPAGAQA